MQIDTKFSIGDTVWVLDTQRYENDMVVKESPETVVSIDIGVAGEASAVTIAYETSVTWNRGFQDSSVFATQAEAQTACDKYNN